MIKEDAPNKIEKPYIPIWFRLHGTTIWFIGLIISGFLSSDENSNYLFFGCWGFLAGCLYTELRSTLGIEGKLMDEKIWKITKKYKTLDSRLRGNDDNRE